MAGSQDAGGGSPRPTPSQPDYLSLMTNPLPIVRALTPILIFIAMLAGDNASAQSDSGPAREAPGAAVVVLPVALYNAQANVQESSDASQAALSTVVLTSKLRELLGPQLMAGKDVASAAASPKASATTGNQPCNVIVACARAVANSLKAPWVVMAKVSKTSNLIWLFTGQLIHAPTGTIILDDSTELKGPPDGMVRAGSRIFAERVARTVRHGGVTTNFPNTP